MPETRAAVDVRSAIPTKQLVIERSLECLAGAGSSTHSPIRNSSSNGGGPTASAALPRRWIFASEERTSSRWSGRTSFPADAQFSHYLGGEYYEIDRPHRLVMSGRAINDDQGELFATLIELTLEPRDGGTALIVRQSYFEPMPPADALAGAEQGWSEQLDKLERLLAG